MYMYVVIICNSQFSAELIININSLISLFSETDEIVSVRLILMLDPST